MAGGMPLAFTQEDFLVSKLWEHYLTYRHEHSENKKLLIKEKFIIHAGCKTSNFNVSLITKINAR